MTPGIFEKSLLSRPMETNASAYIKTMHPKTEIKPESTAIKRILNAGWWGQKKIRGHWAQIHLHPDHDSSPIAYTRKGTPHQAPLPTRLSQELRRLVPLKSGWTVIEAEWVKREGTLFLFDMIKLNGRLLSDYCYGQRWELLPQVYTSDCVETLRVLKSAEACLSVLADQQDDCEGLVFKSTARPGFADTSIIRCRKKDP